MSSRRLDLHASALNDAEYQLYTTSLADITLADEGNEPQNGSNSNWNGKKQETNQCHDDAYYDRLTLSVREARAWFRGRYSHVAAGTIDTILKFFSPNLSATDTLTGGQFFAAIRLIVHAESGKEVDRTLAFVQAHPPQTPTSGPGVVSSTSTSTSTSATSPLPPKRVVPPMPVSRKSFDAAHNNPFAAAASASSQPTETQASQTQTPLQTQPPAPPPQHPSSVSSHNPFSFTTRSKSTPGPPKPFTPSQSQSHDGSSTLVAESITPSNSKLPPLPPRKPPPPVPNASANVSNASSSSTLPTPAPTPMPIPVHAPVPLNPPPPPRHNSLLSNATSFLTSSKSPPTHLPGSPFGSPFSSDQGHNYGTVIPPPLPPKHQATTGHVAHVTSTLMKQSLQASKTGSAMKKAEEQLEKERVLSVLKSSSSRGKSPFGSTTATASANDNNNNGNKGIGLSRTRSVSPKKQWEESSSGSLDDTIRKEPPPLPSRKKKPKSMSTTSPPGSVLSGVSGKSGVSGISGVSSVSTSSFQSVALAQNPSQTVKPSRSNPFDVYRTGTGTGLVSRSPSVSPTPDGREGKERREGWDETQRPPRHPDHNDATVTPSTFAGAGKARSKPEFSTPFSSPFSTPFSSPSTTMSGAKSASPYVASFGATSTSGRYPSELSQASVSPFKDPNSNPNSPSSNFGSGPGTSSTTSSALSSPTAATAPKETGYSPTNTIRLFRSKSMHHPTSSTSSFSPVHRHVREKSPFFDEEDVEDDTERDEFGFKTPEETPRQTPTGTPFKHTQTPPVVRRKRPESMQVLGSQANTLGRHMSMTVNTSSTSSNPPPVATLRQQLMHRRISSSGSTGLGQDESSSSSPIASGVTGTSHIPHSGSQSSSASHVHSHPNPLKSFATSLNSNLEALQPKLDKARYKAEAGLSRRGFVRSRDGGHTGLNGLHGLHENDEKERRREEKEGLMGDSQSHSRNWDRDWKRGVDQLREKEKGGSETRGRSRWEDTMQSDSSDDSDEGPDGYGHEEEEERFRIKGLRRGPSSSSTPSHSANHSRTRDSRHGAGNASERRDPRFGAAGYGSDSASYRAGTGRDVEKDNLKWPVGEDEGWRPL